jgi:hypothetical protein
MAEEHDDTEVPHVGTLRVTYTGPVIPHWRWEFVEGDRTVIQELVRRANAVIGLLPPRDPQFRRNRSRVDGDAAREGIEIIWVNVPEPEERPERPAGAPARAGVRS